VFGSTRQQALERRAVASVKEKSDERRRRAQRAVERAAARQTEFGVAAAEFETVPGAAMRLHYRADTYRLDPDGDARLVELHENPFDGVNVVEFEALCARPYYLVKLDGDVQSTVGDAQVLALDYKRPQVFATRNKDRAVPFEPGADETVVLFTEHLGIPMHHGQVLQFSQSADYDAASGLLLFQLIY
jgi:hypothetical protein